MKYCTGRINQMFLFILYLTQTQKNVPSKWQTLYLGFYTRLIIENHWSFFFTGLGNENLSRCICFKMEQGDESSSLESINIVLIAQPWRGACTVRRLFCYAPSYEKLFYCFPGKRRFVHIQRDSILSVAVPQSLFSMAMLEFALLLGGPTYNHLGPWVTLSENSRMHFTAGFFPVFGKHWSKSCCVSAGCL